MNTDPILKQAVNDVEKTFSDARSRAYNIMLDTARALVFEKFPFVESFAFPAYTPGWSDGDPTSYSAHTDKLTVNGVDEDEAGDDEQPDFWVKAQRDFYIDEDKQNPHYDHQYEQASQAISDVVNQFPEDIYQLLFEEGLITFKPDRIFTDDYDWE